MPKNGKAKEDQTNVGIARNEDIHYTDPFDTDDWEAQERMKAADIRAQKNR